MFQPFENMHWTGRCLSVVGSGGKTTFLRWLSDRLSGSVILTTSTKILPFPGIPLITAGSEAVPAGREQVIRDLRSALGRSRVVCLGLPHPSGKLSSPESAVSFEDLIGVADTVLVEADGAAGRPLKAHRPWEPVVPACSDLTVCMVGASGLGKPASDACHCPELFCELAGIALPEPVSAEAAARVLNRENLADVYLVNQADTLPGPEQALRLCSLLGKAASVCSLRAGLQ